MPSDVKESAFPRLRTNHLVTGTDVTSAPGPLIPTMPIRPNRTTSCHPSEMNPRQTSAPPVMSAAAVRRTRAPKRSISPPIVGAVTALATWRADCAHPNTERPMPRSSPIGLMNSPKLRDPSAMLSPPIVAITATITQP
jgi:hypothetical protein